MAILTLVIVGGTFVAFMNGKSQNDNIFGWFLLVAFIEVAVIFWLGGLFGWV